MLKHCRNAKHQHMYLNILNLFCNYVDLHETTLEAKTSKNNLCQNFALKLSCWGLKHHALQCVITENNIIIFTMFLLKNILSLKLHLKILDHASAKTNANLTF